MHHLAFIPKFGNFFASQTKFRELLSDNMKSLDVGECVGECKSSLYTIPSNSLTPEEEEEEEEEEGLQSDNNLLYSGYGKRVII